MNKKLTVLLTLLLLQTAFMNAQVKVEAMKFGTGVQANEVTGEAVSFPASTEKVYCWVRVTGAEGKSVTMKWYRDGAFLSDVKLDIISNSMRTYSYKTLYGNGGTYKVEILDDANSVIQTGEFTVTGGAAAATQTTGGGASGDDAGIQIESMKFGTGVDKSEIVGESGSFPASTEKVYCWIRVLGAEGKSVMIKWYFNGAFMGEVPLEIKSNAMRTYAFKSIAGNKGEWRAEVCGPSGAVLQAGTFTTN